MYTIGRLNVDLPDFKSTNIFLHLRRLIFLESDVKGTDYDQYTKQIIPSRSFMRCILPPITSLNEVQATKQKRKM
jgi:hypothetical protein